MKVVKAINFESKYEIPMRLEREEDGDVVLTIYDDRGNYKASVYLNVELTITHLRAIA